MADDAVVFLAVPSVWVFFCREGIAYKKVSFMVIAAYIPFYFVIFISFVLFITVEYVCVLMPYDE